MILRFIRLAAIVRNAIEQGLAKPFRIIHKPLAGCPQGYTEESGVFEYRGVKESACIANPETPNDGATDYLRSGESENLRLNLLRPKEKRP